MKNNFIIIVILILIISMTFNIYLFKENREVKNNDTDIISYLRYLIVLRLDRQSYIYDNYSIILNRIEKEEMDMNDLIMYLSGVKEFTHEELLIGVYNIVCEDSDMNELLKKIAVSNNITEQTLKNLSSEDINKLISIYRELSDYLNRNKQENSITYYIKSNQLNDKKLKILIGKVNNLLEELDRIYQS